MNPNIREVGKYMSAFSEEILTDALERLLELFAPSKPLGSTPSHRFTSAIAAAGVAHGAEILIKSAIAAEHPLLLFDNKIYGRRLPTDTDIELQQLFSYETIPFKNLPYALWASTNYRLSDQALFEEFRILRNKIEHLSPPTDEFVIEKTIRFLFLIVDPILRHFWSNDLLALMRPYNIDEYVDYMRSHNIAYKTPGWFSEFNQDSEIKELEKIQDMAHEHRNRAAENGLKVTSWFLQMSAIVPQEGINMIRRKIIRITGNIEELRSFSIPLSYTGNQPATHFGSHTSATEDIALRLVRLMRYHHGFYNFTSVYKGTHCETISSFDMFCKELGLKKIQAKEGI